MGNVLPPQGSFSEQGGCYGPLPDEFPSPHVVLNLNMFWYVSQKMMIMMNNASWQCPLWSWLQLVCKQYRIFSNSIHYLELFLVHNSFLGISLPGGWFFRSTLYGDTKVPRDTLYTQECKKNVRRAPLDHQTKSLSRPVHCSWGCFWEAPSLFCSTNWPQISRPSSIYWY